MRARWFAVHERQDCTRFLPGGSWQYLEGYMRYNSKVKADTGALKVWSVRVAAWLATVLGLGAYADGGGMRVRSGSTSLGAGDCELVPCAVFSHGLAGNRGTHSGLLARIAAQGVVVAAVEHRDGSSGAADDGDDRPFLFYEGTVTRARRIEQQQQRVKEALGALSVLEALNEGGNQALALAPVRGSEARARATRTVLGSFAGRLDVDACAAIGHSFGGLTALHCAMTDRFARCFTMDPWLMPYESPVAGMPQARAFESTPLGVLYSRFEHTWSRNEYGVHPAGRNSDAVRDLLAARRPPAPTVRVDLPGTTHMSCTDLFVLPRLGSFLQVRACARVRPLGAALTHATRRELFSIARGPNQKD